MTSTIRSIVAASLFIAFVFALTSTGTQTVQSKSMIPILTPEQREILSHMSIVYLDDGLGGTCKTIRITGVNVQIVNGLGATETTNCVGNLIVGYNETGNPNGDDRTGSHNLVAGSKNSYSSYGGLVVASENTISAGYATVSAGQNHVASGLASSVSGGHFNTASGFFSSVTGGENNTASVAHSSVTGGESNVANGAQSSVTGGKSNTASSEWASVSGGHNRSATGDYNWAAGSLSEAN